MLQKRGIQILYRVISGLLLSSIAVASTFADSTETVDFNLSSANPYPKSALTGLGPAVPGGNNNPKLKKAMEELGGIPIDSNNYTTVTSDPRTQPKVGSDKVDGLGPQVVPGGSRTFNNQTENIPGAPCPSPGFSTVDPRTLHRVSPDEVNGLGPQTANDDPELRKRVEQVVNAPRTPDGLKKLNIDPNKIKPNGSSDITGLGPQVTPGASGNRDILQSDDPFKDNRNGTSDCPMVCPDVFRPVCGSDGVKYSNLCHLGIASCNYPEKTITKASDDVCSKKSTPISQTGPSTREH